METLISIVFHVEHMIEPYLERVLEISLEFVKYEDSGVKKVAIDAVYALTAIVKEKIVPFRLAILSTLIPGKCHKVKPVRESTLETIKLLKETGPALNDQELSVIDEKPKRNNIPSKSPGRGAV